MGPWIEHQRQPFVSIDALIGAQRAAVEASREHAHEEHG